MKLISLFVFLSLFSRVALPGFYWCSSPRPPTRPFFFAIFFPFVRLNVSSVCLFSIEEIPIVIGNRCGSEGEFFRCNLSAQHPTVMRLTRDRFESAIRSEKAISILLFWFSRKLFLSLTRRRRQPLNANELELMFPFGTFLVCFPLLPNLVTWSLAIGISLSRRENSVIPSLATCSRIEPAPSVLSQQHPTGDLLSKLLLLPRLFNSFDISRVLLTTESMVLTVIYWRPLPSLAKQVVPAHRMADIALHDGVVFDADYYWFYWLCTFLGKERWVFFLSSTF